MSIQRIVGLVLLIGGIVLVIMGVSASRSFGDQLSNFFTGRFSENTMWYIIGGIVSAIAGFILLLRR